MGRENPEVSGFTSPESVVATLAKKLELTESESRLLVDLKDSLVSPQQEESVKIEELKEQIGFVTSHFIEDIIEHELDFTLHLLSQEGDLEAGARPNSDDSGTFYEGDLPIAKREVESVFERDNLTRLQQRLTEAREEDKNVPASGYLK